ncbi:hypothetical protein GCK72_017850 [Caenorhabditis remanei]|uniref:Uncharacterized protein n=1 Tax=Caenorhabditis remanei TaxID=31234 RepID=A0A6A5G8W8_CAERE|nr:hypothetical protein GCK72_017850 [Caenorhabditis remanei]KAF1751296.1 hypothetical protein GCK72_017850 [Caenorhabditis remanei]
MEIHIHVLGNTEYKELLGTSRSVDVDYSDDDVVLAELSPTSDDLDSPEFSARPTQNSGDDCGDGEE